MKNTSHQFSYFTGYSFKFEDDANVIEAWFSSFSGLEKVSVNNELVAEQRNLSTNSSTSFKFQGASYSTNLEVKSIFKGPFVCSLFKNGELFKQQRLIFRAPDCKVPWYGKFWFSVSLWLSLFLSVFIGDILGVPALYLLFWFWIAFVAILNLTIIDEKKAPRETPRIEEVDIEKGT